MILNLLTKVSMKVLGYIFIGFAVLNLILLDFVGVGMCGVIGAYLLYRAEKKKEEADDKKKWENGE